MCPSPLCFRSVDSNWLSPCRSDFKWSSVTVGTLQCKAHARHNMQLVQCTPFLVPFICQQSRDCVHKIIHAPNPAQWLPVGCHHDNFQLQLSPPKMTLKTVSSLSYPVTGQSWCEPVELLDLRWFRCKTVQKDLHSRHNTRLRSCLKTLIKVTSMLAGSGHWIFLAFKHAASTALG